MTWFLQLAARVIPEQQAPENVKNKPQQPFLQEQELQKVLKPRATTYKRILGMRLPT